jgi:hypothetical protein
MSLRKLLEFSTLAMSSATVKHAACYDGGLSLASAAMAPMLMAAEVMSLRMA